MTSKNDNYGLDAAWARFKERNEAPEPEVAPVIVATTLPPPAMVKAAPPNEATTNRLDTYLNFFKSEEAKEILAKAPVYPDQRGVAWHSHNFHSIKYRLAVKVFSRRFKDLYIQDILDVMSIYDGYVLCFSAKALLEIVFRAELKDRTTGFYCGCTVERADLDNIYFTTVGNYLRYYGGDFRTFKGADHFSRRVYGSTP